ncbi:Fc.00g065280.m01.CDS01 [Cosmosporella sp. VM-42]
MRTVEETRALGEVHPEFEPILKSGNPMLAAWTMDTNIFEIRDLIAQMRKAQPEVDPATLSYTTEDIQIPLRDGFQVAARTYKPRSVPADGCSGFIVFHGGGYLVGDLETEGWLCTMFTSLGGIAVNIDYRHAPEHVFPQAINDTFDATKWVSKNAQSLESTLKRVCWSAERVLGRKSP